MTIIEGGPGRNPSEYLRDGRADFAALWLTATTDERECLAYFGPEYAAYMQRTKRFIPFLL